MFRDSANSPLWKKFEVSSGKSVENRVHVSTNVSMGIDTPRICKDISLNSVTIYIDMYTCAFKEVVIVLLPS